MQVGTIKHWNAGNSYGFICPEKGGADVFFHLSAWLGKEPPREGLTVYYQYDPKSGGRPATAAVNTVAHLPPLAPQTKAASIANDKTKLSPLGKLFNTALIIILLILCSIFGVNFFTLSDESELNHSSFAHIQDPELRRSLARIEAGGPFPYPEHDGKVFYNREGLLPRKEQGYYREYTVPTPEARNRGARRIVTGGNPPKVYYYTEDHYRSFRQLEK